MLSNHPSVLGGGAVSVTTPAATSASLDLISSTQGAMLYRNATAWVGLGPGTSGQLLSTQGAAANPIWVTATGGAGDVNGPASATDNAIVRFDGTGGKTVQNSAVTIADTTGDIAGASSLTAPASTDLTLSGGSTSGKILFNSPSATERARLTSTGNLLIGTATDAANLAGGLVVNGSGTASAASNTTTGALRVTGGVGVSGAGYFGGGLNVTKNDLILSLTAATGTSANYLSFNNTGGTHYAGTDSSSGGSFFSGFSTAYSFNLVAQSGRDLFIGSGAKFIKMAHTSGDVSIASTTAASTPTSAALAVAGGIYAGAASVFGSTATFAGAVTIGATGNTVLFNAGAIIQDITGDPAFTQKISGVTKNTILSDANFTYYNSVGGTKIYAGSTLALTLASANQAATFAGAVSVSGTAATWTSGTGSPESVKTAPVGSLYTRTDGGASTTLYVKESGAGNTGWIAK